SRHKELQLNLRNLRATHIEHLQEIHSEGEVSIRNRSIPFDYLSHVRLTEDVAENFSDVIQADVAGITMSVLKTLKS
ncbi:hypothetical protein PENTCL1PPCAC_7388, partial [Pristionchus entomophagus]